MEKAARLVTLKEQADLRGLLIQSLIKLESIYGFPPSVLTRPQRRRIERALGRDLDEFLSEPETC